METADSGFVQRRSTPKGHVRDVESSLQTLQPAADSSMTSNMYSEELDTFETNIAADEAALDITAINSDVQYDNNYSDSEESTA